MNQTLASTAEDNTIAQDDILLVVLDGTEENYNQAEEEESQALSVANMNAQAEKYI